jgi:hypothetical protein
MVNKLKKLFRSLSFYRRLATFSFKEQFSDWGNIVGEFLLLPFFIWLVVSLWEKFNASQGNYSREQMLVYISVTETFFLTFLRSTNISRATSDFSISLARPRSWIATQFMMFYGKCLGTRCIYMLLIACVLPWMGVSIASLLKANLIFVCLAPILGLIQASFNIWFSVAQVLWNEVSYFILPIGKIFLALGGVFGPIIDFNTTWKTILLKLPPADLFFQPAHYCVTGSFYELSMSAWLMRIGIYCFVLMGINVLFLKFAKKHHQSYGG